MKKQYTSQNAITILVPTYNCILYTERCISSIISQNIDPQLLQVIIYDDDSTDGTLEVIKKFASTYPNQVQYFTKTSLKLNEKLGINLARKKLIELCKTKYFIFLDADDWFLPKSLQRYIAKAQEGKYQIVFARSIRFKHFIKDNSVKKGKVWYLTSHLRYKPKNGLTHLLHNSPYIWATLFDREFVNSCNYEFLPHCDFMEDFCFVNFVLPQATRISSINKPCHAYLNAQTSSANPTVQAKNLPQEKFAMAFMYFEQLMYLIEKNKFKEKMTPKQYQNYINNIVWTLAIYYVGIFFVVNKRFWQVLKKKSNKDEALWVRIVNGYTYELNKYNLKLRPPKIFYKKLGYHLELKWRYKHGTPIKFVPEIKK